MQLFSAYYGFGGDKIGAAETRRYGTILIVLSAAMILGSLVTHLWIPDVQHSDGRSKTLEVLARGRMGQKSRTLSRVRQRLVRRRTDAVEE